MTIQDLLGSPILFLEKLYTVLEQNGIDVSIYEMDHICYRVADLERYVELKQQLTKIGALLAESMIGGRPIATFKLANPIQYQNRAIWVLELPAPKVGSPYPEGFEHVEFVIDLPFDEFMALYPDLPFQTKAMNKAINADIQLAYDGFGVKFHRQTLEYVITYLDS